METSLTDAVAFARAWEDMARVFGDVQFDGVRSVSIVDVEFPSENPYCDLTARAVAVMNDGTSIDIEVNGTHENSRTVWSIEAEQSTVAIFGRSLTQIESPKLFAETRNADASALRSELRQWRAAEDIALAVADAIIGISPTVGE